MSKSVNCNSLNGETSYLQRANKYFNDNKGVIIRFAINLFACIAGMGVCFNPYTQRAISHYRPSIVDRFLIHIIFTTATANGICALFKKYVEPKLHTELPPPRIPAYELLGLLEGASSREVRAAHHRLVKAAYQDVDAAIKNGDTDSKAKIEDFLEALDIALTELTVRSFLEMENSH